MKKRIKADKKEWINNIAKEAEDAAANHHMKTLYSLTKTLSNEKPKKCVTINNKDGKTITNSEERKERWKEHFSEILNRPEPEHPLIVDDNVSEISDIDINPGGPVAQGYGTGL